MIKIKPLLIILGLGAGIAFPMWSYADEGDEQGWSYELVVGIEREPTYVGSDRYITEGGGDLEASYQTQKGHRYYFGLGEIGAFLQLGNDWGFGAEFEYEEGRDNSEDPILSGFAEVEDTVEGQLSLVKQVGDWSIAGVFQADVLNRGKGLVYFLALGYDNDLSSRLSLNTTLDISFADAEHMNTEVGITNAESAVSGLNTYTASSGYKSTTLGVNIEYAIAKQWQLITDIEAEFYGSNIADSPLVRDEGNDVNYSAGLGVEYIF